MSDVEFGGKKFPAGTRFESKVVESQVPGEGLVTVYTPIEPPPPSELIIVLSAGLPPVKDDPE